MLRRRTAQRAGRPTKGLNMTARIMIRSVSAAGCLLSIGGCATSTPAASRVSRAELEQQLEESRALVSRYEKRYGKLLPSRPAHDFRKLQVQLKGKPANTVAALLGKPAKVYSMGATESWDYANIAFDPVSGRTVRNLEIWFRDGLVAYMNASY
jgi:hypothetical protein